MTHLSEHQLEACKRYLTKRQSRLIKQLKNRFDLEIAQTDSVGELSSYDNHPGDLGTELFERGKDLALVDHAERELEEINEALHAIHEGTYGICRICSIPIPYERLKSNPTADTCIEHAEETGQSSMTRPIEEEIIDPQLNPEREMDEETNFYDREDAWQDVAKYGSSDTPSDLYSETESPEEAFANSDEQIGTIENVEQFSTEEGKG